MADRVPDLLQRREHRASDAAPPRPPAEQEEAGRDTDQHGHAAGGHGQLDHG
ncbi:hypothetical protein [Geodermatophilus sp. SYSU D00815]